MWSANRVVSLRLVHPARICILVLCVFAVIAAPIKLHSQCTGKSPDPPYRGGDQNPLTWFSLERLEQTGGPKQPPTYTYERSVQNHSSRDVTDVYWPVAGYERKIVPAGQRLCEQTMLDSALEVPSPTGPLHYGVGTSHYLTTVYAPGTGWPSKLAFTPPTETQPELSSAMEVAVRTSDGFKICTIRLMSSVAALPGKESVSYRYEFSNEGEAPVRVFWDIPRSPDFLK